MSEQETAEEIAKRGREKLTEEFPWLSSTIKELEDSLTKKYDDVKVFKMVNAMLGFGVEHRLNNGSVHYDRESRSEQALYQVVPEGVKYNFPPMQKFVGLMADCCESYAGKDLEERQEQSMLSPMKEHLLLRLGAIEGNAIGLSGADLEKKEYLNHLKAVELYREAGLPIEAGFDKGGQESTETRYNVAMILEFQAYKGLNSLDVNADPAKPGERGVKLYQHSSAIDYLNEAVNSYEKLASEGFQPAVEAFSRSLTDLGKIYLKGDKEAGASIDPERAVSILKEAKEAGSQEAIKVLPEALTALTKFGTALFNGSDGVAIDPERAVSILKQAKEAGSQEAIKALPEVLTKFGTALFNGSDDVARDTRGAIAILEEARSLGNEEAGTMLKKPAVRLAGMVHKFQDAFSSFKSGLSNIFKGGKSSSSDLVEELVAVVKPDNKAPDLDRATHSPDMRIVLQQLEGSVVVGVTTGNNPHAPTTPSREGASNQR